MDNYDDLYCLSESLNFLTVIVEAKRVDEETMTLVNEAVNRVSMALVLVQTRRAA